MSIIQTPLGFKALFNRVNFFIARLLGATAIAYGMVPLAWADAPLGNPAAVQEVSHSGRFKAVSSPGMGTYVTNGSGKILWRMKGWFRQLYVSDDGMDVVTVHDGLNLLPLDYRRDIVLVTIWHKGSARYRLVASEIIPDASVLERTASHYLWGDVVGLDERSRLVVKRVDGVRLIFDIKTGQQLPQQRWREEIKDR